MPHLDSPELQRLVGKYGMAKRYGHDNVDDLHRDYVAERIAEYARRAVADAPPLTAEQRDRIAAILAGGSAPAPEADDGGDDS